MTKTMKKPERARRTPIDRRAFLVGAGGAVIALPFFEEFAPRRASAQSAGPVRVVTAFFGLGLDPAWQAERFAGPLEPYEPLASKIAFFTNVNMDQGTGGAHCENSPVVFVGERNPTENISGGASIDQLVRAALDASAPTLASGLWWRRGACDAQAARVWNADGTARAPIKRPSELFERLFGGVGPSLPGGPNPDSARQRHTDRSVLDAVMAEYSHYVGARSPLGTASKQKLELHLNSIREVERQLAPSEEILGGETTCVVPEPTDDPNIAADYDRFTYGTGAGAPDLSWQDFESVFRLHADLWALGLSCDVVRYGNLMFESAGGHTNLAGTYSALGESTTFPGDSQHDSYFHENKPKEARLYQHFAQRNVAYFLQQLEALESAEGRTLLDDTTVVIGTEYGWNHSSTGVFHAIAGATDRFKPGFYTQRLNAIDVYNAVLVAHGLPGTIGEATGVDSEGSALGTLV